MKNENGFIKAGAFCLLGIISFIIIGAIYFHVSMKAWEQGYNTHKKMYEARQNNPAATTNATWYKDQVAGMYQESYNLRSELNSTQARLRWVTDERDYFKLIREAQEQLLTQAYKGKVEPKIKIDYNKNELKIGDQVFFNGGDCFVNCTYSGLITDKNGYMFPHIIKTLRKGIFIKEENGIVYLFHNNSAFMARLNDVIPQQNVVICSW